MAKFLKNIERFEVQKKALVKKNVFLRSKCSLFRVAKNVLKLEMENI